MKKAIGFALGLMLMASAPVSANTSMDESKVNIETKVLEDGQCTARIIMADGTIYEATADTCLEAVLAVKALKNIDK